MPENITVDTCSFCTKHKDQVGKLIVGHGVAICNECIDFCQSLLEEAKKKKSNIDIKSPDPRAIHSYLDQYVVGQQSAKKIGRAHV